MKIKPLSDHILVEPVKPEEKTRSGILLPDTAEKDKPEQGTVLAAGSGRKTSKGAIPLEVKAGDKIIYKSGYGAEKVEVGDKECVIIKEEDVLAILE
ncbi:MAG: co-chaperone GroES [Candidatus Wildermuthbacteria bacterium RIFCSPHIGHO2_01_FULL_47_27]|uniref:Co-chaperonin GroES n=2 Tax=Candidatus Wildermuthiibacteriota TaxID=1817923 RepID=A0A1G2RRP2_9BACT|nr:MAG: 10 kDa chaperonin [Parcubacteria group bacterium GW2011_GWA2_47_9]OHA63774.1 MAG: co-chaperone GroES [Candidatus Wildermuthbacteria bacterium RIFCSPHIGHO2_01_FULL_47_27]OHA68910.1 MAG: co-chaperone GroES [Candidatus Wildermuthbacteria bacterium RIFCSPHIGHO2_02_FULL_47_17]OHA75510.1 MAG: co-chaperone GroES [Candidatus Wildermuthbacteria bacterium RIFCSPLOWO2_02_FULL_47_10]OHA75513.1 MAG: co-chaperone GroES [Candidatus Wildermuthbacteria bacterium RIFCSPLOWO2_01_FULL_48_35]